MNHTQLLESQLRQLDAAKLAAFCTAVAQRQFPNFALFSNIVDFGDAQKMATVLDGAWQSLVPGGAQMNFTLQLGKVEDNMPDVDDYDMYGVTPALDAITCLHATLNCILEQDAEEAVTISQLSRETVAGFIEVTQADDQMSDADVMRLISTHELMAQEDDFQQEVLERLMTAKTLDKALIKSLKELAHNEGFSNIGICV
ncbi:MAG: YjaG family protein [Pseudomonadales bacterium]